MGEDIAFKNGRISDFQGLVTLPWDRVILHTVMHHSSTSTYIPNFVEIKESFCGRTDGRTDGQLRPTNVIRLTRRCRPKKGKGFPYSLPSVGPGADPGVQAVSPEVTISHPHSGRLPLLSARPAATFPTTQHHRPLAGTKLYCLGTDAHRCEQLAQCCYAALPRVGFEPTTCWSQVQCSTCCTSVSPPCGLLNPA